MGSCCSILGHSTRQSLTEQYTPHSLGADAVAKRPGGTRNVLSASTGCRGIADVVVWVLWPAAIVAGPGRPIPLGGCSVWPPRLRWKERTAAAPFRSRGIDSPWPR